MMRMRAATLCVLLFAIPIAFPAKACVTKAELAQRVATADPAAHMAIVQGEAAQKIAIGIAQLTGAAVPAGGDYVLVDLVESELTYVVRFAEGCATHHGRFPTILVQSWITGLAVKDKRDDGR